jgi:hypothetical protein
MFADASWGESEPDNDDAGAAIWDAMEREGERAQGVTTKNQVDPSRHRQNRLLAFRGIADSFPPRCQKGSA